MIYITTGTYDFLERLRSRHAHEKLTLMYSSEHALLLHETDKKTIFQNPRKYDVIEKFGDIPQKGYAVFHHIPVLDEGRSVFEYEVKNRKTAIKHASGIYALRILRPHKNDTYIILTCWENEKSFKLWADIQPGGESLNSIEVTKITKYPRPSYFLKYVIEENQNNEDESY